MVAGARPASDSQIVDARSVSCNVLQERRGAGFLPILRAMSRSGLPPAARRDDSRVWESVRERLHDRGLRWTPQRRTLVAVLSETHGHITGAELVERCRERDPSTIPSTVYRTLDVLEELGIVRHGHGPDGREEYHVLPEAVHGHLHCEACGASWEISADEASSIVRSLDAERGFEVDLSHVTIVGRCRSCR
jgi:Fur family ferric uptake transcriptional regulator